jgi:4-nitrophenyl phosphatase
MTYHAADIKAVILDLDGVIYRGQTPIRGAAKATDWLHRARYHTYYFTNNSTRTRDSYVELLAGFDIDADADHIVTSASLTAEYLAGRECGRRPVVLVVGEDGLVKELRGAGLHVVRRTGKRAVDYVVVGMDRDFTYRKLHAAQQAIRTGAEFIATNRDATYPVEDNVIPGGGSIVAAVATAAEREPVLIGKPSRRAGMLIARHAGVKAREALVVGDRLETDILVGRRAGMWTCMVLTGISGGHEAQALPANRRPHWIVDSIAHLPALLRKLRAGGSSRR